MQALHRRSIAIASACICTLSCACICTFARACICKFACLCICKFARSYMYFQAHSWVYLHVCSCVHLHAWSNMLTCIRTLCRSVHVFAQSVTHAFARLLIHTCNFSLSYVYFCWLIMGTLPGSVVVAFPPLFLCSRAAGLNISISEIER